MASSSNSIRLAVIEETTYGQTPVVGNFDTVRIVSESLSGSPETTESQQIRQDRMSSGQIVTGLNLGGNVGFELSKDSALEKLMSSAMRSAWTITAAVVVDLSIDATAKTISRAAGNFNTSVRVGDMLTLAGFSNSNNNTQVMVTAINSDTEIKYAGAATMDDEVGVGTSFKVADYLEIGTSKRGVTIEKAFTDLTNKGIAYRGMLVSQMSLDVKYGSIVTGSFEFSGNGYGPYEVAADAPTNGRTVNAPATSNPLNGSVDMPTLVNSASGVLGPASFFIQGVTLELNNNDSAQTAIGYTAPVDYSAGTASISVSLTSYLVDDNWMLLAKKLTQESFALGWILKNSFGAYGFYMPALQVSFDDPNAGGQNQDAMLNMSGMAKVGPTGASSALRIYRA